MTDTKEEVEESETTEEEVEVEPAELQVMWLPNGLPIFLGDVDDVLPRVKEMGYLIFYVLGSYRYEYEEKVNNQMKTVLSPPQPRLFRVTSNMIGHAVTLATNDDLGLEEYDPMAFFNMPKIPYERVLMLDNFFRKVDEKFKSEAIVLLTYDPRIGGSEGWGILVPKQENNEGHCKYFPESIVDDKDDEVIIVGSAHSHPGMSAFASHTDHGDQLGNDGIHITFGWKHGSNVTEHYIELQLGGGNFTLEDEQAFKDAPEPPEFEETDEWIKNVKKKSYQTSTTWTSTGPGASGSATYKQQDLWGGKRFIGTRDPNLYYDQSNRPFKLPDGCPDPRQNTVVLRLLDATERKCPMCDNYFRKDTIERHRCWDCMSFILLPGETIEEIVKLRDAEPGQPVWELIPGRATKSIVIWERKRQGTDAIERRVETYHEVTEEEGKD